MMTLAPVTPVDLVRTERRTGERRRAVTGPDVVIGKHPQLFLDVLAGSLGAAGMRVRATASSADELMAFFSRPPEPPVAPLVIVLDCSLCSGDPQMLLLGRARRALPQTPIVIVTEAITPDLVLATVEFEIEGVVFAESGLPVLTEAIHLVAAGESVLPSGWLAAIHRARRTSIFELLSARQIQVLGLVAYGFTNAEIAIRLTLSPNTVKFHLREIYDRLGVDNRVQAGDIFKATVGVVTPTPFDPRP